VTTHYYIHASLAKGLFPLRLRVALRGVAWREKWKHYRRLSIGWFYRHATQRAAVMETGLKTFNTPNSQLGAAWSRTGQQLTDSVQKSSNFVLDREAIES